jgi:hypothetical protein
MGLPEKKSGSPSLFIPMKSDTPAQEALEADSSLLAGLTDKL